MVSLPKFWSFCAKAKGYDTDPYPFQADGQAGHSYVKNGPLATHIKKICQDGG